MTRSKPSLSLAMTVAALVGLMPRPATAQVTVATCAISASSAISFGAYSVFNASPTDSTGTIVFVCTGAAGPVSISLTGTQATGSRSLKNGADLLTYNVFTDASRTRPWGDGTFGSTPATFSTPVDNTPVTATMYGRIFARQDVSFGAYSDSLLAVVNF